MERTHIQEVHHRYYLANRDAYIARSKEWAKANPAKNNQRATDYYYAHRQHRINMAKKWNRNHPEQAKKWERNHPDWYKNYTRNYRRTHK